MDERQQQLREWAQAQAGIQSGAWHCVAGDASSRRYFRLCHADASWICVDSPPLTEKNHEFLQVREWLSSQAVLVPELLQLDSERGFLLLGDLGELLLLDVLNEDNAATHYRAALELLRGLYGEHVQGAEQFPSYNEDVLLEELGRFPEWFCEKLLGCPLTAAQQQCLDQAFSRLVDSALEQPRVFVHRDFHSRNLLLQADGRLGVIDFQDALYGPVTYDAVSLLRDCYIRWPGPQLDDWLEEHRLALEGLGIDGVSDKDRFRRWFDHMGLQRHIKVLGTFARLSLRDGKAGYLQDLPRVLAYIEEVVRADDALAGLAQLFDEHLSPAIRRQDWSRAA